MCVIIHIKLNQTFWQQIKQTLFFHLEQLTDDFLLAFCWWLHLGLAAKQQIAEGRRRKRTLQINIPIKDALPFLFFDFLISRHRLILFVLLAFLRLHFLLGFFLRGPDCNTQLRVHRLFSL